MTGRPIKHPWPMARDPELIARVRGGQGPKVIAHALGVHRQAVIRRIGELRRAGRIGFVRPPWSPAEERRLLALRAKRLRWREIGAALGRSPDSCKMHACALRQRDAAHADRDQFKLELAAA